MAKHTRTLHFKNNNNDEQTAQLYTTLGDVVENVIINEDGTTGGITLYTTGDDTGYPALRIKDGDDYVYAKLVSPSDSRATNLKCVYNGTTYAVGMIANKMDPNYQSIRGDDITDYFDSGELSKDLLYGDFTNIRLGDYIQKVIKEKACIFRVAGINYFNGKEGNSILANHLLMVVDESGDTLNSFDSVNSPDKSYLGSTLYNEYIPQTNYYIEAAFGAQHILAHYEQLQNTVNTDNTTKKIVSCLSIPSVAMVTSGNASIITLFNLSSTEKFKSTPYAIRKRSSGNDQYYDIGNYAAMWAIDSSGTISPLANNQNSNRYGNMRYYFLLY